ncbi:MAG: hypothetical protein JNL50_04745 [Phycisphaerae bacterium]|nr:hypothetical protein [Phycisphaerae bacterium]
MRRTPSVVVAAAAVAAFGTLTAPALAEDWIIGLVDPNEVVEITSPTQVDGDIILVNSARLRVLSGGVLSLTGKLAALHTSRVEFDHGVLQFPQTFAYQSGLIAADDSVFTLTDTRIEANHRSFGVSGVGRGRFEYDRVNVATGFSTWALFESAGAVIRGCQNTGEFVPFGTTTLDIADSEGVLFWLTLFKDSTVDLSFPPPGAVASFVVSPDVPWGTGIPYTASIASTSNVRWGVMARSGSSGTFRDSTILGVGSYFEHDAQPVVQGLATNTHMTDSTYQWADVRHRFVNTSVRAWNFYAADRTRLSVRNSIVGECHAYGDSVVEFLQSTCDGSGGFISVDGHATMLMLQATNLSQMTVAGHAIVYALYSSFTGFDFDVKDNAIMLLANSQSFGDPAVRNNAGVFDVNIEPVQAVAGATIPIRGSARVLAGPEAPFQFDAYAIQYRDIERPDKWLPLAGPVLDPVDTGELATWRTRRDMGGVYTLRLSLFHNLGEPIAAEIGAFLQTPCPADRNSDAYVNGDDFDLFAEAFEYGHTDADFNEDGFVNGDDYDAFAEHFEAGC